MPINLVLVRVKADYCDYLRKFDSRVAYNKNEKELRPFVGILFSINGCEYFAPLSSPKPKHLKMKNALDFLKIKNGELGALNFNNMIPVNLESYSVIDFKKENVRTKKDKKYLELLKNQLAWLNANSVQVKEKASKLYYMYVNNKLKQSIKNRCCNFLLLEEKCIIYNVVRNKEYVIN